MNPLLLIFIGIVAGVIVVLVDKVSLGLTFVGCAGADDGYVLMVSGSWIESKTLSCGCGRGEEMRVEDDANASRVRSSGIV